MADELNQCVIAGVLQGIRQPFYTEKGVMRLTIFVNTTPDGTRDNDVPVQMWGDLAEFVNENIKEDQRVVAAGKVVVSSYKKKDTDETAYFTFINARYVELGQIVEYEYDEDEDEEEDEIDEDEEYEEEEEEVKPKRKPRKSSRKSNGNVKSVKNWSKDEPKKKSTRRRSKPKPKEDYDDTLDELPFDESE